MNNQPQSSQDSEPFVSRQQYRQQQAEHRQAVPEDQPQRRQDLADERTGLSREEKINRLKRRLNIAIVALIVAIIVVYLILFYVG